ncbi:hypothetical protein GCM10010124_37060 [Pilimelia terevasa]|uniref:Protein kinase domain-containing protein n=1 Tax=Pilimelia terevasa TaxID=53372 RepID=A0A8J3FJX4_9ACTN|nr:hypothetical protein [Pilimelia terevasa]GGK40794.1 hypothetical protein GCM10010124_37060 [Pilimelia terevasa]
MTDGRGAAVGVKRVQAAELGDLEEIGSGGQGRVYAISPPPSVVAKIGARSPLVYKAYFDRVRPDIAGGVLDQLAAAATPEILACAAWPLAIVDDGAGVAGFVMPRAPDGYRIPIRLPSGDQMKLGQVQHLLNDDTMLTRRNIAVHDRWRLEFLRDTARTMALLHRHAIVVGDLSPMNLLASFDAEPRCYFIDCDAMRIYGADALAQVETTGWGVPSGEELATSASDAYKFALLAVRLFAGDQETRDPTALDAVSPELCRLAVAGLGRDVHRRPAPDDWLPALTTAGPSASTVVPWQRGRPVAAPRPAARPRTLRQHAAGPRPKTSPPRRRRVGRLARWALGLALLGVGGPWAVQKVDAVRTTLAQQTTAQVTAVQKIIRQAGADRRALVTSVNQISRCRNVGASINTLKKVGVGRARSREGARALKTSRLPDGTTVATALAQAMDLSLAADRAFVRWGEEARRRGCSKWTLQNRHRDDANKASAGATAAKRRFAAAWNPIARQHGRPAIRETDL